MANATPERADLTPSDAARAELGQATKDAHFAQQSAARSADYGPLLGSLGLSPGQVTGVLGRLDGLHRGAIEAGDSMLDLMQARALYDREMKSLLGEEAYAQYRAYEHSKAFQRELAEIRLYSSAQGSQLSPESEKLLAGFLEQIGLCTTESWAGPYDPPPRPAVGKAALAFAEEYIARINTTMPLFLELSSEAAGLSSEERRIVTGYFQERLSGFEEALRLGSLPPAERRARSEAYVQDLIERSRHKP